MTTRCSTNVSEAIGLSLMEDAAKAGDMFGCTYWI
jgi:hypothetical protein